MRWALSLASTFGGMDYWLTCTPEELLDWLKEADQLRKEAEEDGQ